MNYEYKIKAVENILFSTAFMNSNFLLFNNSTRFIKIE